MNDTRLAVLGGDARQVALLERLRADGISALSWGLERDCGDWREVIYKSNVLILPLPISMDGVRINTPLRDEENGLRLDVLLQGLKNQMILGGKIPEAFVKECHRRSIRCIDYFADESLQLKNALSTAEGAMEIAMRELPVTLFGTSIAVLGYGRIGSLLSRRLRDMGAIVTVYARREEVLTAAFLDGHLVKQLTLEKEPPLIVDQNTRVIFNTVPTRILTEAVLKNLPDKVLIIDLASAPGGVDSHAAKTLGLRHIWATALPGKYAPISAGFHLAETVEAILRKEGLL